MRNVQAQYRLDDGRETLCFEQPVWCYACESIRCAERLPEIEMIESQIRKLEDSGLDDEDLIFIESDRTPEEHFAEKLDMFQAMLEWRLARKAPSRCWDCGSTELVALRLNAADNPTSFVHPFCGGQFECEWTGHALQQERRLFDSEGFEIRTS